MQAALPELPGLAAQSLRERPVVVVDSREQTPLVFRRLQTVTATLQSGDYSFIGGEELLAVERKSISDLVACCIGENRERFSRELHRLRGFRFKRLLVVGSRLEIEQHHYHSKVTPKSVLSTLAAFEVRYDIPVVWAATADAGATAIEGWVWWSAREVIKAANEICPEPTPAGIRSEKAGMSCAIRYQRNL